MERGFFRSLFDISFTSFITTKIIKVVYVVTLVLAALAAVIAVIAAFREDTALGIVTLLVAAPLADLPDLRSPGARADHPGVPHHGIAARPEPSAARGVLRRRVATFRC
jgi:hypothetical protein